MSGKALSDRATRNRLASKRLSGSYRSVKNGVVDLSFEFLSDFFGQF